jgi:hypothetical protein
LGIREKEVSMLETNWTTNEGQARVPSDVIAHTSHGQLLKVVFKDTIMHRKRECQFL